MAKKHRLWEAQRDHQVPGQREKRLLLRRRGFAARVPRPSEIADEHDADGASVLPPAVPDHVGQFVALVDRPIIVERPVIADVRTAAGRNVVARADVVVVDSENVAVA